MPFEKFVPEKRFSDARRSGPPRVSVTTDPKGRSSLSMSVRVVRHLEPTEVPREGRDTIYNKPNILKVHIYTDKEAGLFSVVRADDADETAFQASGMSSTSRPYITGDFWDEQLGFQNGHYEVELTESEGIKAVVGRFSEVIPPQPRKKREQE